MTVKFCGECGTPRLRDANFCGECGERLEGEAAPSCGYELLTDLDTHLKAPVPATDPDIERATDDRFPSMPPIPASPSRVSGVRQPGTGKSEPYIPTPAWPPPQLPHSTPPYQTTANGAGISMILGGLVAAIAFLFLPLVHVQLGFLGDYAVTAAQLASAASEEDAPGWLPLLWLVPVAALGVTGIGVARLKAIGSTRSAATAALLMSIAIGAVYTLPFLLSDSEEQSNFLAFAGIGWWAVIGGAAVAAVGAGIELQRVDADVRPGAPSAPIAPRPVRVPAYLVAMHLPSAVGYTLTGSHAQRLFFLGGPGQVLLFEEEDLPRAYLRERPSGALGGWDGIDLSGYSGGPTLDGRYELRDVADWLAAGVPGRDQEVAKAAEVAAAMAAQLSRPDLENEIRAIRLMAAYSAAFATVRTPADDTTVEDAVARWTRVVQALDEAATWTRSRTVKEDQ